MVETGSYNVNTKRKDSSFKSFVCALLAFLALLILISLLLFALRNRGSGSDETDKNGDKYEYDFMKGQNRTKQQRTTTKSTTTSKPTTTTKPTIIQKSIIIPIKQLNEEETTTEESHTEESTTMVNSKLVPIVPPKGKEESTTVKTTTEIVYSDGKTQDTTIIPTVKISTSTANISVPVFLSTTEKVEESSTIKTTTEIGYTDGETQDTTRNLIVDLTTQIPTSTANVPVLVFSPTTERVAESSSVETTTIGKTSEGVNYPEGETQDTTIILNIESTTKIPTSTANVSIPVFSPTTERVEESSTVETTTIGETSEEVNYPDGETQDTTINLNIESTTEIPTSTANVQVLVFPTTTETVEDTTTSEKPATEVDNLDGENEDVTTNITTTVIRKVIHRKKHKQEENSTTEKPNTDGDEDSATNITTTIIRKVVHRKKNQLEATSTEKTTTNIDNQDATPETEVPPVPTTCSDGVCKRAASSMLALMDHEDNINRCEDYYKFICDGPERNDKAAFFEQSFRGFVKKIQETNSTSEKYLQLFADFYDSCNQFGNSINRIERLKELKGTGGTSLTESIIKSILTQTMPFFDIGLNIKGKEFKLEITLPGLTYLKTTLDGWSLIEQLKDDCINEQTDKIKQNIIDLNKMSTDIKTCIGEKTAKYVKDFVEEVKQVSAFPGFEFLDANVKAAAQSTDLAEILNTVQDSLASYRTSNSIKLKESTLADLKTNYDFGLDWIEFFKGITKDVTIDEKTVVYLSEHLDGVFKKLIEKKANLQPLLDLWYNTVLYKNIVVEKEIDKRGHHCLDITTQLMPEVSSAIIAELNMDKEDLYKEAETLMKNLTVNFYESVIRANMTHESAVIIQDRLSEIDLIMPLSVEVDGLNYLSVFDKQDSYPKKLISLLSHFRKILYSLDQTIVLGSPVLKYFINAFETKPKSFPPSRVVVFQPGFMKEMSRKLPTYVKIAKVGLPLAEQISKHFTKNDFAKPLNQREIGVYELMEKTFDTQYLMNKVKYTVGNVDFEVEDGTGNHLSYDDIFADNTAFRLDTDTFNEDKKLDHLPFMQDYTRAEAFVIISLQEYCHKNTLADFVEDYYNRQLPAPVKLRNIVKNSEFYAKLFKCTEQFERKQFPYIKPTSP